MKRKSLHPLTVYHLQKKQGEVRSRSKFHLDGLWRSRIRVPRKVLHDFTRSFAMMLKARLPLMEALEMVASQCAHKKFKAILVDIKTQVERGKGLAESFSSYDVVFDSTYINLTRVGETAGILDTVLLRLATHQEKSEALRRKVRSAMAYPIVVLVVALLATIFLLTSIVPTFAEMFEDFGATLPAPTLMILSISKLLMNHAWLILATLAGFMALMPRLLRRHKVLLFLDTVKIYFPLIGQLLRKNLIARFCRTLGTLLENSIGLMEALEIIGKSTGNRLLDQKVLQVRKEVSSGKNLFHQLEKTGLFPEFVIHMIMVGEESAELDKMLLHVAEYYEVEVEAALETTSSILEPILIVLIGLVLGGILVALYLPMFDLVNIVG